MVKITSNSRLLMLNCTDSWAQSFIILERENVIGRSVPLTNAAMTSTLSRPTMGRWDSKGEDWPPALICRG